MDELLLNVARSLLNRENYKKLQSIEDRELKMSLMKGIAKANYLKSLEGWSVDMRKEYINSVFDEVLNVLESINKAIELEYKIIEKLRNIRNGVAIKAFELGSDKLREIRYKFRSRF